MRCRELAFGQEKKIARADLPAAVQHAVDQESQGATVRGLAREQEFYEVELTVNGHTKDVLMDSTGAVVLIEEEVALASLPAAVQAGLRSKAGAGTINRVEALTKHGTLVAYEGHIVTGDKRSEIQVGPDGKPLDHEE